MDKALLDEQAKESLVEDPAMIYYWIVLSSYAYYTRFESLLSDEYFDKLCKQLSDNWENRPNHQPLDRFVTKSDMDAGTGYTMKFEDLPRGYAERGDYLIGLVEHRRKLWQK